MFIVLVLVALSGTAVAEPELAWRAPTSCPSAAALRKRVERRLRGPIDPAIYGIDIEVVRDGSQFVANIDARAVTVANAVRELRSRYCDALADGVAVILARLSTEVVTARTEPEPEPEPDPIFEPVTAGFVDDARLPGENIERRIERWGMPMPTPRPQRTWGGGLRFVGLSGIGALPGVNLGGEVGGYVRRENHFAELAVAHWAPQRTSLQGTAPAGIDVTLEVVTARGGWGPETVPLRAWGTVEIGSMSGEGMSVLDARTGSGQWAAVGGGFGVAWPMSPYARLVGSIELMIPVGRTRFTLDSGTELWRPTSAAARSALGLEVGFR
ncbi:MAG: hypothetical protein SFX73_32805 [Kofleriaceae bacterium]|nr:hypothetical protein [Kofleriaceae bacterium]